MHAVNVTGILRRVGHIQNIIRVRAVLILMELKLRISMKLERLKGIPSFLKKVASKAQLDAGLKMWLYSHTYGGRLPIVE